MKHTTLALFTSLLTILGTASANAAKTTVIEDCKGLVKELHLGTGGPSYPASWEYPAHVVIKKTVLENGQTQISAVLSGINDTIKLSGVISETGDNRAFVDNDSVTIMEFKSLKSSYFAFERDSIVYHAPTRTVSFLRSIAHEDGLFNEHTAKTAWTNYRITCGDMTTIHGSPAKTEY